MEVDLKWVHMARYGLKLGQDEDTPLGIILNPSSPRKGYQRPQNQKNDKQKLKSMRDLCQALGLRFVCDFIHSVHKIV